MTIYKATRHLDIWGRDGLTRVPAGGLVPIGLVEPQMLVTGWVVACEPEPIPEPTPEPKKEKRTR